MHLTKDDSNSSDLWTKKEILGNTFEPGKPCTHNPTRTRKTDPSRRNRHHEPLPRAGEDPVKPHVPGLPGPQAVTHDAPGAG